MGARRSPREANETLPERTARLFEYDERRSDLVTNRPSVRATGAIPPDLLTTGEMGERRINDRQVARPGTTGAARRDEPGQARTLDPNAIHPKFSNQGLSMSVSV
jgi:hypothetical protein